MIDTDVVIIGAGPGGSAAAIYLAERGVASVIVEQDTFPRYHIGESLTGEVGQRIRELGLGAYMSEAGHPKKFGVNVYGPAGNHTFRVPVMERPGDATLKAGQTWQVPRDEFDHRMLEEAQARGSRLVIGRATAVLREGDSVRGIWVTQADGKEVKINARVTLDASGQTTFLHGAGVTSKKVRGTYDKQIAIYSQLMGGIRNEGPEPDNTLILYQSRHHWAWFIPINDSVVSVGVVVPSEYYRSRNESMEEFFLREVHALNPELKRRLPTLNLVEKVRGSSNYSYTIDRYVGDGFICVGDSHRFIDPVFSFGLHLAIHEAELAANAIVGHLGSTEQMCGSTFEEYQRICDIGMNTIQELVDAFWNNPHAFTHAAHVKYKEDIIDIFAGRIYRDVPSAGLLALQKINRAHKAKADIPV